MHSRAQNALTRNPALDTNYAIFVQEFSVNILQKTKKALYISSHVRK